MQSSNKTHHCTHYQHDSGYWIQALATTRTSRTKPRSHKASPGFPQTWETHLPSQASQDVAFLLHPARYLHASTTLAFWMPGIEEHRRIACGFSWVRNIPSSSFWHNLYHNIQDTLLQTMWHYIFSAFSFFKSFGFFTTNEVLISWQRGEM